MSTAERAWLPETAFTPATVGAALEGAFAAWSSHWFVDARMALAGVRRAAPAPRALSGRQLVQPEGSAVAADLPPRGKRLLLESALGDFGDVQLGEADHRLLDDLATAIVEDLLSRIGVALSASDGAGSPPLALSCSLDRQELLTLHCPEALLVAPVKAASRRASPARPPLAPWWSAVLPSAVVADACLGRATLSLGELGALAIGDIIVLDRDAEAPAELVLGDGATIARGALARDLDRRALLI